MNKLAHILSAVLLMTAATAAQQVITAPKPDPVETERWAPKELQGLFTDDVRLRMIALPSFGPAYGVALKQSGNHYRLVYHAARANRPSDWFSLPIPLDRCETTISPELTRRLVSVWRHMIEDVLPHEEARGGLDGESYVFALRDKNSLERAETWSPDKNTPPALLIAVGDSLAAYCSTARYWFLAPVTWYNEMLLNKKLGVLESVKPKADR